MVSKKQCEQIMKLPIRTNIWNRRREANHSGAVRRAGEFLPQGPESVTVSSSRLCYRCNKSHEEEVPILTCHIVMYLYIQFQSEEVQAKMSELFIVMDSMEEELEDTDSGLDSSDENYMNIEIFA